MTENPNSDLLAMNIVKEVVGESLKIGPTQPAVIKVKSTRVQDCFLECDLELRKEVVSQLGRNMVIPLKDAVQIRLNSLVEPSFHGTSAH